MVWVIVQSVGECAEGWVGFRALTDVLGIAEKLVAHSPP